MADIDLVSDLQAGTDSPVAATPNQGSDTNVPPGQVRAGDAAAAAVVATTEQPAPKQPTIRERLSSAFKGASGETVAQADAVTNTGQQPRAPDGTFAPKPAAAAAPAAGEQQQQAVQPLTVAQPPVGLTHEEYQQFTALPAETQQIVARTMEAVNAQAARFASYDGIENRLIAPRREAWAINGMSEEQALTQLFALSDFATQRPADFVQWFAGSQNINLATLAHQPANQQQQLDPVTADLQRRLHDLQGQVQGFTTERQQQEHTQVVSQIQAFADEKDAAGQALRPYFQELGVGIQPYVVAVRDQFPGWTPAQILQEAYDRACWATPAIRMKLQAATDAQRLQEQAARTARARHAGGSVSGAPSAPTVSATTVANGASIRDNLRAAFASQAGGV